MDKETEVMRVDLFWHISAEKGAMVEMSFECEVCGLSTALKAEKKPKHVIKEISFD